MPDRAVPPPLRQWDNASSCALDSTDRPRIVESAGEADVPMLTDQGAASISEGPYAIAGPAGMVPPLAKRIVEVIRAAVDDPDPLALLDRMNQRPAYMDPAETLAWASQLQRDQAVLLDRLNIPRQR
jgi:tripartite-type tricarboxylate transporter receptor subunit TctC